MLNKKTVQKLQAIVQEHKGAVRLPKADVWKSKNDNELWLHIVGQVGVVGGSAPAEKMNCELKSRGNWYEQLVAMKPAQRRKEIHKTLRSFGIRYVSETSEDCRKTNALIQNLALVESYGGTKAYLKSIAGISDEHQRISAVIKDMAYIKNKGARDFLIGLGIIENAIAIDVRIKNVLAACGVSLPEDLGSSKDVYKALESELLEKVCKPCGVPGAVLDRILYQKYKEIVKLTCNP